MKTNNYTTRLADAEMKFYINKFQMKMSGCIPSVAAEWIDGINKGTQEQLVEIFRTVRNEMDWTSFDGARKKGDMPVWFKLFGRTTTGTTFNREGRKVKVSIPTRDIDAETEEIETIEKELMTPADQGIAAAIRDNQAAAELNDEENPAFLFSCTWTSLLTQIAKGDIDANYIAKVELANRGLDLNGQWVGFAKAKRLHGIL